jgi:hypothetical protein
MNLMTALSVPVSLLIIGSFVSVLGGFADFTTLVLRLCLGVPVLGYLIFSIFSVVWAVKIGDVGIHQNASHMSKFIFWHGISVVAVIVLSAAGSFIVLFGKLVTAFSR